MYLISLIAKNNFLKIMCDSVVTTVAADGLALWGTGMT